MTSSAGGGGLARRLGTGDAVLLGLGSMIGAGVFAVFGPAAQAAGSWLLIGLLIAAVVAYCNAVASAQLAAVYPTSGGTYMYGRERLGAVVGVHRGLGIRHRQDRLVRRDGAHVRLLRHAGQRLGAATAGGRRGPGLAGLNLRGMTKTALLTRFLVTGTLMAWPWWSSRSRPAVRRASTTSTTRHHWVRQGLRRTAIRRAAVLRVRRLRPHRHPGRGGPRPAHAPFPRAIPIALFITVGGLPHGRGRRPVAAGPTGWPRPTAPLVTAVEAAGVPGSGAGCPGRRRARQPRGTAGPDRRHRAHQPGDGPPHDLPAWLAPSIPGYRVPHNAEMALAVLVSVLVLTIDLRG